MITSRRSLLASFGLALPAASLTATGVLGATGTGTNGPHKTKSRHASAASHKSSASHASAAHKSKTSHVAQGHRAPQRKPKTG
jgi:hypothetical protein